MIVFNNKTFMLYEVADEQLASSMARGCPPIDAGENIKLYCTIIQPPDLRIEQVQSTYILTHGLSKRRLAARNLPDVWLRHGYYPRSGHWG